MSEKKRVGLALGGGGARGFAHIGVLKVLEKYKIPIDFISGTSIGALIGALYSAEPNAKKLEKEALETNWNDFFDYTFPQRGLVKGTKIEAYLEKKLENLKFNQLKIPMFITAFDIENKQEVIFHKGHVAKAIRASISIPGIFVPVENNGRVLVDGGLTDLIPTEIIKKEGAEVIIAVNVDSIKEKKRPIKEEAVKNVGQKKIPGVVYTISKSLQIMGSEASKSELSLDKADIVINLNLENLGTLDFSKEKIKSTIKKGEIATTKIIKKLTKITENNPLKEFLEQIEEIPIIKGVKESISDAGKDIKIIGKKGQSVPVVDK